MKSFKLDRFKLLVGSVLVIGLLIGTFYDYQISQALYHPNAIGIFFASYGQLPAMLTIAMGSVLLIQTADKSKKLTWWISMILGGVFTLLAILGIAMDPMLYMESMPAILSGIIAAFLVLLTDYFFLKAIKGTAQHVKKQVMVVMLATVFLELILINLVKIPWGRPRMRLIAVQSEASFQPWWVIGSDMKQHLMALGVAAEEFKSFPSGHSGNAACAMLLGVLPLLCPRLKGKETMLFLIGALFTIVVAGSRIMMGAHFLSDVVVGISITFMIEAILLKRLHQKLKQ